MSRSRDRTGEKGQKVKFLNGSDPRELNESKLNARDRQLVKIWIKLLNNIYFQIIPMQSYTEQG